MVAAQQVYFVGEFYFVAEEEDDGFETAVAAVDIVAQEEIGVRARGSQFFEDLEKVVELSVDVAADENG